MAKWITRRRAMATGAASVAVVGVAGGVSLLACGPKEAHVTLASINRLNDAVLDIKFAKRISAAMKAELPEDAILAAVQDHPALQSAMRTTCPTTRRAQIRAICQEDFKTGECLVIDRLVVSKTECLIAGLCA